MQEPNAWMDGCFMILLWICCSNDNANFDGPTELKMDLRFLAPLWKLYKSLSEEHGPEQTSAVLRALTELFFTAENVAMVCTLETKDILGLRNNLFTLYFS